MDLRNKHEAQTIEIETDDGGKVYISRETNGKVIIVAKFANETMTMFLGEPGHIHSIKH